MKRAVLFAALVLPSLGWSATLTGTVATSSASVDLATVGTLDWARWPGYTHKASNISNVTYAGVFKTYGTDPRLVSGTRDGIKVSAGSSGYFQFTVAATTQERTLIYYFGGWNSNGRLTVSMPGATTYTANISGGSTTYSRVATIKFKADTDTVVTVRWQQTSSVGSINMQAAALQGSSSTSPTPTTGSALLTWVAPTANADGTVLTDLNGFRVRWGTTQGNYPYSTLISNASARSYTVSGLTAGRWYFVVTAMNSAGVESTYSNAASKLIE